MKIGIIVYSQSGNTFSVAERLKEKLKGLGHSVEIEKITVDNDMEMDAGKIKLTNIPDANNYDALILGSPVRGFSLSAAMTAYLKQAGLKGKSAFCYATQFFPFPIMGGNRAMGQMKNICESKEIKVRGTGIINWSSLRREKMIDNMVEEASKLF